MERDTRWENVSAQIHKPNGFATVGLVIVKVEVGNLVFIEHKRFSDETYIQCRFDIIAELLDEAVEKLDHKMRRILGVRTTTTSS